MKYKPIRDEKYIRFVEKKFIRDDLPEIKPGDKVRVITKIFEGDKEKLHPYEGIVIYVKGKGVSKTFCVRKVSEGVGVEIIFPYHSPQIASIEVIGRIRRKVRRAKLYFIREKKESEI